VHKIQCQRTEDSSSNSDAAEEQTETHGSNELTSTPTTKTDQALTNQPSNMTAMQPIDTRSPQVILLRLVADWETTNFD